MFRFISGLFMGAPVALTAYYILPHLVADISLTHIAYISIAAMATGALWPSLLLKGIAATYMWRNV